MSNKKTYNKLVRDKIPTVIKSNGKLAKFRVLNDEEYKYYLRVKLIEEVEEFLVSEKKDDMAEELADIKEVIDAIINEFGLFSSDMIKTYKYDLVGGFEKRYFLESVADKPKPKTKKTVKKIKKSEK